MKCRRTDTRKLVRAVYWNVKVPESLDTGEPPEYELTSKTPPVAEVKVSCRYEIFPTWEESVKVNLPTSETGPPAMNT
jgi:hypothetical protein